MISKKMQAGVLATVLSLGMLGGYAIAGGKNRQDAERAYNKLHSTKEQLRAARRDFDRIHSKSANWENTKTNALQQIDQAFQALDAADAQLKAGLQGIND